MRRSPRLPLPRNRPLDRRILLTLALAVVAGACGDAGKPPAEVSKGGPPSAGKAGRPALSAAASMERGGLRISPAGLEFGDRGHGERVPLKLTLENLGDAPLRILEMKPSCGCTRVRPASIDEPIPPGRSVDLTVTMSSGRIVGELRKYISIRTDGYPSDIRVSTNMSVFPGFQLRPYQFRFEGEVDGREVTQTVDILRPRGDRAGGFHFVVDGVYKRPDSGEKPSPHFDSHQEDIAGGKRIHLTLKPTHPEGRVSGTLVARLDGKPFHVSVSGEMFRGLKLSPRYFNFNRVELSDPDTLEEESFLTALDGQPFEILSTEVVIQRKPPAAELSVDLVWDALDGGSRYRLLAVLRAPGAMHLERRQTSFSGEIRVETSHPEKPRITYRFMGFFPIEKAP